MVTALTRRGALGWLSAAAAGLSLPAPASAAPASLWSLDDEFTDEYDRRWRGPGLREWAGPLTIAAMDSAECRFICSTQWRMLMNVQEEADRRKLPLRFVIVSVDPANDTPALWRAYRREKSLSRDNWRFLTGSQAATNRASAVLGIRWWRFEQHVIHDFRIVRLNAGGRVEASMDRYDMPVGELLDRA